MLTVSSKYLSTPDEIGVDFCEIKTKFHSEHAQISYCLFCAVMIVYSMVDYCDGQVAISVP